MGQLPPAAETPMFREGVPLGLGARSADCVYTKYDYASYEKERDDLLRSSKGRVALMMGGIVWRLAMECIGVENVLRGPGDDHTESDLIVINDCKFLDDTLSEHELDVICGVYRSLGRKCTAVHVNTNAKQIVCAEDSKNQEYGASDKSWWPKHKTWMTSGMSIGHWTDKDERWFRRRLYAIKHQSESPKHARKWASALKNHKKQTNELFRGFELLARNKLSYLNGQRTNVP